MPKKKMPFVLAKKLDDEGRPIAEPAPAADVTRAKGNAADDGTSTVVDAPALPADEWVAQAQEQIRAETGETPPSPLADWRRKDLHNSGITDETIDRLKIKDDPGDKGWIVPWTDAQELTAGASKGYAGFELIVYDRDKRPDDGRKTAWPKGTTPYPSCFREVEKATSNIYVEGQRQALAVASYAPDDVMVWCLPGIELSAKIAERLAKYAKGLPATVISDGDWRRNRQVGGAVTERLPEILTEAGATEVRIADVGGTGTDGIDDIIGRTTPELRAPLLAKILDQAQPARDRRLELATDSALLQLQARDQAQRLYVVQTQGQPLGPHGLSLAELLAIPDEAEVYRVSDLWQKGGNVVFSAQRKAGKTTLRDNLVKSVADGDAFLGQGRRVKLAGEVSFGVVPLAEGERVYVADLELDQKTLRRWLRAHQIQNGDRVMAQDFRGAVGSFDVLDDRCRQSWAVYLSDHNVKILILDPLAALLGAYGYDENDNTGIGHLLAALDVLKADAGIGELMVIHHMGHAGERSRGASRLRDWPDAEWRLVRERPDNPKDEPPPDAARFFAAEGRDVALGETRLSYDYETRRLSVAGGNRVQHKATKDMPAVLKFITDKPGQKATELEVRGRLAGISRDRTRAAIATLIGDGQVRTEAGPKNATLHYPASTTDPDPRTETGTNGTAS